MIAVNKIRLKSIFSHAKTEYIMWVTNPRIIIVGVLLIFMKYLSIDPLLERSEKYGESLNVFEPFISIGNSTLLIMLIPCTFLVLISDYPTINGNTLFFVHRIGKINWFLGQLVFIVCASLSYLFFILIASILFSNGSISANWSNTITKYNSSFPNESNNYTSQLIPSNLYNQLSLSSVLLYTFFFILSYLIIIALILSFFKLINAHSFGLFIVFCVMGIGTALCFIKTKVMWLFPVANTLIWRHFDRILSTRVFPIYYSILYFISLILFLLICNIIALSKIQFININQVGE